MPRKADLAEDPKLEVARGIVLSMVFLSQEAKRAGLGAHEGILVKAIEDLSEIENADACASAHLRHPRLVDSSAIVSNYRARIKCLVFYYNQNGSDEGT
jgi:hypothetical protein